MHTAEYVDSFTQGLLDEARLKRIGFGEVSRSPVLIERTLAEVAGKVTHLHPLHQPPKILSCASLADKPLHAILATLPRSHLETEGGMQSSWGELWFMSGLEKSGEPIFMCLSSSARKSSSALTMARTVCSCYCGVSSHQQAFANFRACRKIVIIQASSAERADVWNTCTQLAARHTKGDRAQIKPALTCTNVS